QLGDLEFLVVEHALEALARAQHLDVEIDAVGLDAPVHQRTSAVIVPAGERELKIGHWRLYYYVCSTKRDHERHEEKRHGAERDRQEGKAGAPGEVPGGAAKHRHEQSLAVADGEHRS